MKIESKMSLSLQILGLVLGILTVIMGINESTADILDKIGSNYWLAYSAIASGVSIIIIVILSRRLYGS